MNSYIEKYEFISPVTYEFLHMNSYVSDPCLVYKKMATDRGDGAVDGVTVAIASANWSRVQIPKTWILLF